MKVLGKWKDGYRPQMSSWNTSNSSYWGYLKVWQPKRAGLQDLQTWKGQQIIKVRISYSLRVEALS